MFRIGSVIKLCMNGKYTVILLFIRGWRKVKNNIVGL